MANSSPLTFRAVLTSPDSNDRELAGLRRMWDGGPLRQFGETQASCHYVAYSSPFLTGYAGSYVCDGCLRPSPGVCRVRQESKWLCGACKEQMRRLGGRQ